MVELLISYGANVNVQGKKHRFSLLHLATILKNKEIIDILISHGAFVNQRSNEFGITPFILASLMNSKEIVQLLISHGANINMTDKFGNNAIAYALLYNNKEIMKEMLIKFSALVALDYKAFDMESDNKDLMELLISSGVNINQQNSHDNTPLHIASLTSNGEIGKILISHGADINALNENDYTPLDFAIMRGKKEYNKEFRQFGKQNQQDFLDFLKKKGEMVALLYSHNGIANFNKEFKSNSLSDIIRNNFYGDSQIDDIMKML
ncbi:ankyrin repeat protein, putative [Trichomonas vaginalis G3]|uniref:Ankyrin repeat protein, putative n=1 Tax=Trichomonas vaginalis (strain ATCC PRA-98 / G3) TaxID=412133 RepID=A2FXA8_TRIV3|nr:spectrin binding [Trichomonas vaginalis G3]EAX90460.1 ankyrin repeat protein, putative [Trichomonas vaginalis G3]KAI5518864.1 spectrin binding [Trichomonas vaginalis G3]|eukprot:XP_001303390.1 ankyrin repeat protein [Trichomonas vaginalis G3]